MQASTTISSVLTRDLRWLNLHLVRKCRPIRPAYTVTTLRSRKRVQYSQFRGALFCIAVENLQSEQQDSSSERDASDATLELLEWPRFLNIVSSFAGTSTAKEIIQSSMLPTSRLQSEHLLSETSAAIDLLAFLGSSLDFGGIRSEMVRSCFIRLEKGFVISGNEAVATLSVLQFTDTLQQDLKTAVKQNYSTNNALKSLLDKIYGLGSQPEIIKSISRNVDDDGNVKDSASSELQRARVQYRVLETRIQELLKSITRDQEGSVTTQEVDGRFCIVVSHNNEKHVPGLLLKSGIRGSTSYIEPVALVSLNDKLAEARALIRKAEHEALRMLSNKLIPQLEKLSLLLESVIELDVVVARAKFCITFEGSRPTFTTGQEMLSDTDFDVRFPDQNVPEGVLLHLRKAYHPLLLHQYREHAQTSKIKIYKKTRVKTTEVLPPVPIDIIIPRQIRVVTITGPNTGGKTAAMKMLGLASLMAKFGLYVLAKDPVYIPWFDKVFADIGDEQSLFQSLSTFSGHLCRINHIKEVCTGDSLVLLDEVGTGTNPIEGAALGMAILESFATDDQGGSRLTFASTHHAELKTLKYSDNRFENASVEFDEETLKPTYRLLWGIPGRSNALNISRRLGIPAEILDDAQRRLGTASLEINQVIMDLENLKREFEDNLAGAERYLKEAKKLHGTLKEAAEQMCEEKESSSLAAINVLQELAHEARSAVSAIHLQKQKTEKQVTQTLSSDAKVPQIGKVKSGAGTAIPDIGEIVFVPKLGKEATVSQVIGGKKVIVQSGPMQLRLDISDIRCQR